MIALQHDFAIPLGSTIAQACVALAAQATRTGTVCTAPFNGRVLVAGPDADPVALTDAWWAAVAAQERFVATPARLSERLSAEAEAVSAKHVALGSPQGSA